MIPPPGGYIQGDIMDIVTVIIQAVVQGLTEFLPVSSSGHLSVVQHITGVDGEAALILSLVLHLGTLAAVFIAFWCVRWSFRGCWSV